jgi:HlyD family secretion protein
MADTHTAPSAPGPRLRDWNRRTAAVAGICLMLAGILAWLFRPQPVPADFARAIRGELVVTIDDESETRVRDVYVVSAPVAGRVERIELDVGDSVVADSTVLALFQPQDPALLDVRSLSEAEAGIGLARADQARARAELDFARQGLKRAEDLAEKGTVSLAALDRARLLLRTAQAAYNQASAAAEKRQTDLRTARAAMETARTSGKADVPVNYIPVRAPVSGRVLRRLQESATLLPAGTPLLEIGDPASLEIVTDLLSTDAVKVREGDEVIVDEWGGPRPLNGKVRRIEPFGFTKVSALGVEEQRVNVIIDIISPREEWAVLGHGYRVITRIITDRSENTLKVPVGALFRTGADWSVYRVDGNERRGRAALTLVEIGARNTLEAEVTKGLSEGDVVIVHPSDEVSDGARVSVRE